MPLSFYNNIPKGVVLREMIPMNSRSGVIAASSIGSIWWPPMGQSTEEHMHLEQSVMNSHLRIYFF